MIRRNLWEFFNFLQDVVLDLFCRSKASLQPLPDFLIAMLGLSALHVLIVLACFEDSGPSFSHNNFSLSVSVASSSSIMLINPFFHETYIIGLSSNFHSLDMIRSFFNKCLVTVSIMII